MEMPKPPAARGKSRTVGMAISVVLLVVSFVMALFMISDFRSLAASGVADSSAIALTLVGYLAIILPLFLGGAGMLVWNAWPHVARVKVARPEVSISSQVVHPGDTFTFHFCQTFKRAAEVRQASVELVLREMATYGSGKSQSTIVQDIVFQRHGLPARLYQAGERLSGEGEWRIPAEAMHTFASTHNRLRWLIVVQISINGWPDFREEYEVRVRPKRLLFERSAP